MAELQGIRNGLRGLYQDLSAISDGNLSNVDRLCLELETHIQDFRKLLDKPAKNNASRQAVLSGESTLVRPLSLPKNLICVVWDNQFANVECDILGKITVAEVEYSVNSDFQQGALQLADALDIDELQAAEMFLVAQEDSKVMDRPPLIAAIISFHERRLFILECLRLIFKESYDTEHEATQSIMQNTLAYVLEIKNSSLQNASLFARKALNSMADIEKWMSLLGDQAQKATLVGQDHDPDIMEAIEFQRGNLQQQHESLGAVLFYMFKGTYTSAEDFRALVKQLKTLDRFDGQLFNYIPVTIASFVQHGSPEGSGSEKGARDLHKLITSSQDGQGWKLPNFHASLVALWLSVYSGWYFDGLSSPSIDAEKESEERTKTFMTSLDDGALIFMLAICSTVNNQEWADPARSELVSLLLRESVVSLPESETCSDFMKELLMENFEVFVESCVANMPDAVRRLKSEEDSQRLEQITALRDGLTSELHRGLVEARTHLESLLMIISFAFEHREEAAQEFWADPDGNLHGFLQWASKRQTVPRVSAFCEMLCSISEGEANATAAHRFLSEEDKFMSSKFKRSTTMNWSQMFAELKLYASRVTEKPSSGSPAQGPGMYRARKPEPVEMNEPESPVMLTCYLRLMGHLCKQSEEIRLWMLQNEFDVVATLLDLCSGPIPSHLRATTFSTLSALMTNKSFAVGKEMWARLDAWLSGGSMTVGIGKVLLVSNPAMLHQQQALQKIGESFDQTNAFVGLINSLVSTPSDLAEDPMPLSFPETLGGTYRMSGIEPYIDFVLGHAFSRKIQDLNEYQSRLLTFNCLEFVVESLRSFNEDLVLVLSQPSISESPAQTSSLLAYVRSHPFARVLDWLFNEDVLKALFAASKHSISEVVAAQSDSVLVLTLLRSLEVMNLLLDLQSTYFSVVKSLVHSQPGPSRTFVANSSLASFEDSVLNNLSLIPSLCVYCGTGHQQLTVVSMSLLEKLTSSRKLNRMSSPELAKWQSSNKIVEVLASEVDVDSISRPLVYQMTPDVREFDFGPLSAGYVIRERLLALLNSCLGTITDRPTVAHLLLGFNCVGTILDITSEGLFANQMSLLHNLIVFLKTYPEMLNGSIVSWVVHLKRVALQVLKHLWSSKLASFYTLGEMRVQEFLRDMFAEQLIIGPHTGWNECSINSEEFWLTDATTALAEFLLYRSHLFNYAATEVRSTAQARSPALHTQILSTLLGNAVLTNGESMSSPSVFDLFDFADLDVERDFSLPNLSLLRDVLLTIENKRAEGVYNTEGVDEMIQIRRAELSANGVLRLQDEEQLLAEANDLKLYILATSQRRLIQENRYLALRSWVELVGTIVTCSALDEGSKPAFILHTIQLITPKLTTAIETDLPDALELARLAEVLIGGLASDVSAADVSRSGDVIDEKLHQLFQICLRGTKLAAGNMLLREALYSICSQYITRITSSDKTHENLRHLSQQAIKAAGSGLIETMCDDAYTGQETCRASALVLLNNLAVLDRQTDCVLAELISRSNYLSLFLDALRSLPLELNNAQGSGKSPVSSCNSYILMTNYKSRHPGTAGIL
jgi:nuclear pore complex protein Nup205